MSSFTDILEALVKVSYSGYGSRLAGDFPSDVASISRDGDALLVVFHDDTEILFVADIVSDHPGDEEESFAGFPETL